MRYFSLFSGIGGFELGIEQAYDVLHQEKKKRVGEESSEGLRGKEDQPPNERHTRLGSSGTEPFKRNINSADRQPDYDTKEKESGWIPRNGEEDFRVSGRQETEYGSGDDSAQDERHNGRSLDRARSSGAHSEEGDTEYAPVSEESESEERGQRRKRSPDKHGALFHAGDRKTPLCVGYSEIDRYAIEVYKSHFPDHEGWGDITKIDERRLPDFELLCGGFPCQSFSIAGKRGGFEDTRGTLFFHIARIARHKRPRLLFLENVKGLLSHDGGRTFNTIIAVLDELGYDLQWQVLNSKNHGVPQNRERVFIIGHLRGTPRPKVFPFTGQGNENTTLGESTETAVARTLTGGGHSGGNHSGMTIIQVNNPKHSNDRIYDSSGLSPTLNTMQGGMRQPFVSVALRNKDRSKHQGKEGEKYGDYPKNYHLEPQREGLSFTVKETAHENWVLGDDSIRRLTPLECERLQGFPDGWTEGVSDTQRYRCLGNAVTVNVIQAIMDRLKLSTD